MKSSKEKLSGKFYSECKSDFPIGIKLGPALVHISGFASFPRLPDPIIHVAFKPNHP